MPTVNVYDSSVLSWSPDAVEPQLLLPAPSRTVKLKASTTYPKGALISEMTDTVGTWGLYADAAANGLGTVRGVLPRAYVTDASGNIYEGAQASAELPGMFLMSVPAYVGGAFKQADLVTLNATAWAALLVSNPGAKILSGTIAGGNAIIQF